MASPCGCYNEFMQDSIFTRIIKGEVPCHKVYEDEQVIAFLDINPINPGHTLVVPKQQVDHLWDIDDPLYEQVMKVVKKVAGRQREVLQPKRVGLALMGFDVPHAHAHVFPLHEGYLKTMSSYQRRLEQKLEPDHAALAAMAKKLAFQ